MIQVKTVRIVDAVRSVLAYRTEKGWADPHGGTFSAADITALDAFAACSGAMTLMLGEGKWRREHPHASVQVTF